MKFKLSTKLLGGFLLVSVIGGLVGILGIIQLTSLNQSIDFIYRGSLKPITYLVHMKSNFIEQRLNITKVGMVKKAEEAAVYSQAFQDLAAKNLELNKLFKESLTDPNDIQQFEEFEKSSANYVKAVNKIIVFQGAGDLASAQKMILDNTDTGAPAMGRLHQANFDRLVANMEKHASTTTEKVIATGAFSIAVMAAFTVVGIAVSILLAIWLGVFQISRPLSRLSETLQAGATQISSASRQLSASSQDIANGATEQASSIEETSASMEELSSMVKQNLANSRETSLLASRASEAAEAGQHDMTKMVESMRQIAESSEEVSKVISLIDSISFKTNILALNAAVEAARAGDAGLGFAVVADEVKNLANRSADAAKDTAAMIKNSIKNINEGNAIADRLAESFKNILQNSRKVAEMSREVEEASTQQETGIGQVTKAIIQFDEVVQANASASEETASAAEELTGQASSLMGIVQNLSAMVNGQAASKENAANGMINLGETGGDFYRNETRQPKPVTNRAAALSAPQKRTREVRPETLIPFENDEDLNNQ